VAVSNFPDKSTKRKKKVYCMAKEGKVELISTREAAEILKVTTQAICKIIWDGRLRATKLGNATSPWRIDKESVMKYVRTIRS
jgi:excisionase family DNA binding protein